MVSDEDLQYGGILSDYVVERFKERKNPIDIAYDLCDKNGLTMAQARDFVKMIIDKKTEGENMFDDIGKRTENLVSLRDMFNSARLNGDADLMVKIESRIAKTKGTDAPIVVHQEMTKKDYEIYDGPLVVQSIALAMLKAAGKKIPEHLEGEVITVDPEEEPAEG